MYLKNVDSYREMEEHIENSVVLTIFLYGKIK